VDSKLKTGIYKILNTVTNDFYIGSASVDLKSRKQQHFCGLKLNKHRNIHLQRAYNKYGKDSFVFNIIEYCIPADCIKREQFFIDTMNPHYNIDRVAGSRRGYKMTKEQIEALSKRLKGKPAWNKGIPFGVESRKKMSEAKKGKPGARKGLVGVNYNPVIRSDGVIFNNPHLAAMVLNVKANTIIKAISDQNIVRKVRGFIFKYYRKEDNA